MISVAVLSAGAGIPDRVTYSSDNFGQMYDACKNMIAAGQAYADDTEGQTMKDERFADMAGKCRNNSVDYTMKRFEEMKAGSEEGLRWCIRAKIPVDNVNKALRDPVLHRCNLTPHHRLGSARRIYATYDFCVPFVDALEE